MILFLISEAVVVMNQSKFDRNLGVLTEKKTLNLFIPYDNLNFHN